MAVTSIRERTPEQARVDVRVVDSDIHPTQRPAEWMEYVPEPYRSRFWKRRRVGNTINYDAPDYAHAMAMRMDTFPEDGGFPGSDPELAFRQVIMEAGSDIGILIPFSAIRSFRSTRSRAGSRPITGRRIIGLTARRTGTSGGVVRSASRSRIQPARSKRSSTGPGTRTWPRS